MYNVGFLAEQYDKEYAIDNNFSSFLILRQESAGRDSAIDYKKVEEFWEKAKVRSSGKYYGGLINFCLDHEKYHYYVKMPNKITSIRFEHEPINYVKTLAFINDGTQFINKEYDLSCTYSEMMQEYTYVNFRTQSQFFLILLNVSKDGIDSYAEIIQYVGMLAQEICIENSQENVFNRPVKQIRHSFWKPILEQNEKLQEFIPFYGVITGKESVSCSAFRDTY